MRKITTASSFNRNSYNKGNNFKLNNFFNNKTNFSTFNSNYSNKVKYFSKNKAKTSINLNLNNFNTNLSDNNNNSYLFNKYKSPYVSNFSKYINMYYNPPFSNIKNNDKNSASIESYNNSKIQNKTYNNNNDINLMTMKLNFALLKHKVTNLNNIILPNDNISAPSNLFSNNIYFNMETFNNNNINNFGKNIIPLSLNNDTLHIYKKKKQIREKYLNYMDKNKNIYENNKSQINPINNHLDTKIKEEIKNEEIEEKKINEKYNNDETIKDKNTLKIDNEINLDISNSSKKESQNNSESEDELSQLADDLILTLKDKKNNIKESNPENEIKNININEEKKELTNKPTNINNNYIITNISGTINYIAPIKSNNDDKKKKNENIKKFELKIENNSFSINSIILKENIEKENIQKKGEEDIIKSISINLLEEENKKISESIESSLSNDNNHEIKLPGIINSPLNIEKKEVKKDDNCNNNNNNINLPIDSQDESIEACIKVEDDKKIINNEKKDELNQNKEKENTNEHYIKIIPSSDNSRNCRTNNLLKNENFQYNKKLFNSYNSKDTSKLTNNNKNNKKSINFENELIYISYNCEDKPTKIKLYKVKNNKNDSQTEIKFYPKNTQGYINGLSLNKKLKSILLNKTDNKNNTYNKGINYKVSSDSKVRYTKKFNNRNILKRNIDFIKKVEKKVKRQSIEKNREYLNNSESNKSHKKYKKKIDDKNNIYKDEKRINIKKKKIENDNILNYNNNSQKIQLNNLFHIETIQEEEEGYEDSKFEKKI